VWGVDQNMDSEERTRWQEGEESKRSEKSKSKSKRRKERTYRDIDNRVGDAERL